MQRNDAGPSTDEQWIRRMREHYNAAIARRDADAIVAVLAPDYHVVTGRSDQSHGADEQRTRWHALFRRDPALTFTRTPREIRINAEWGLAEELGDWSGSSSNQGETITTAGVYAAKWQRTRQGRWLVQAEMFTTLHCSDPDRAGLPPAPILD